MVDACKLGDLGVGVGVGRNRVDRFDQRALQGVVAIVPLQRERCVGDGIEPRDAVATDTFEVVDRASGGVVKQSRAELTR